MSKTVDTQIEKSRTLIEGLRRNLAEVANKEINAELLNEMEARLGILTEANRECDALREQLSGKVKHMNALLDEVKQTFAEKKKIIKGYYPQEEWARFGVMDKR